MYQYRSYDFEQINIAMKLSGKPSIDIGIHWLNPLFVKC